MGDQAIVAINNKDRAFSITNKYNIDYMQNMQNMQNILYMQAYKGTKTQRKARLHRTVALVGRA
jgi:hypothetical protein